MSKGVVVTASEFTALNKLIEAYTDLVHLGWTEPRYFKFPEEGQEFELVELGSTGIHRAVRHGSYVWVDGEWPSHPFLVRAVKNASVGASTEKKENGNDSGDRVSQS